MLTEWVLVIWMGNEYPMTNHESFTAPIVLDRFNKEDQCINTGLDWKKRDEFRKHFQCIKIEKEIQTNIKEQQ